MNAQEYLKHKAEQRAIKAETNVNFWLTVCLLQCFIALAVVILL